MFTYGVVPAIRSCSFVILEHYLEKYDMALLVNEIFFSLQGESLNMGRPCVFVRLTGCNLRCTYCDTTYAYEEGEPRSIPEILQEVERFDCSLIEVTGGEPLLQPETPCLIDSLLDTGHEVMLETNGSFDVLALDPSCVKIIDVKCPSSGESSKNYYANFSRLTSRDQVKFVMGDQGDYDFAKKFITALPREFPRHHILFTPISGVLPLETLAEWILRDYLPVRLHIQLHKYIWPGVDKGR